MTDGFLPDTLHRLVKHAVDSGQASSFSEAQEKLQSYAAHVAFDASIADDIGYQAAFLSLCSLCKRVFLGGVTVSGHLETPLKTMFGRGRPIGDVATDLGAEVGPPSDAASLFVVGRRRPATRGFSTRLIVKGWRGGVVPVDDDTPGSSTRPGNPLAGVLAASLAVSNAYAYASGERPSAHREYTGLSLWSLDPRGDWLEDDQTEPDLAYLPSDLWIVGLGHLGQAYLWSLGMLPYATASDVRVGLQDTDQVAPSTFSTSVLTPPDTEGIHKTRLVASWAEDIGFRTLVCERLFDGSFKRQPQEPAVALFGVDNRESRRALDTSGFDLVIEAGLGRGHQDFRRIRLHVFPQKRAAAEIWAKKPKEQNSDKLPAYHMLVEKRILDYCGMTLLADKAVGGPFVGAFAASLAISELIRRLHSGKAVHQIDADVIALECLTTALPNQGERTTMPAFALAGDL